MSQQSSYKFSVATGVTAVTQLMHLGLGMVSSIIIARDLGPEGNGVYALAVLLPSLLVTFSNLGIGSSTVYYVARREFQGSDILGSNVLLSITMGLLGSIAGLILVYFFHPVVFPGVPVSYLFIALLFVPLQIFATFLRSMLLGFQRFKEYNYVQLVQSAIFVITVGVALLVLKLGVAGALFAGLVTWLVVDLMVFRIARAAAGGVNLIPNVSYIKRAVGYGVRAHASNVLAFLIYRVDMFLVGGLLSSAAAGLYAVAVGLAERLWILSRVASVVLLPKVAAETKDGRLKTFTPLVARTVLWTTGGGALLLALAARAVVRLLYSDEFLPVVDVLRSLLIGVVMLSASRILASDIVGRGRPILNAYRGLVTMIVNVVLNVVWIPRFGIVGSGWASTVSYTISFIGAVLIYCHLSGSSWVVVVLPQRGDWALYKKTIKALWDWGRATATRKILGFKKG